MNESNENRISRRCFLKGGAVATLTAAIGGLSLIETGCATPHPISSAARAERVLHAYQAELERFRKEFGGARSLPATRFFLFGMGPRKKLLYKDGRLLSAIDGSDLRKWSVKSDLILPSAYSVIIRDSKGGQSVIWEDETAVWIDTGNGSEAVEGTSAPVRLPTFRGHRYASVLRVLHQELLVNVIDGKPTPNFFVYPKPWYRDGAMMGLALKATGNLDVMRDWILRLSEPYDRNNAGETEADNLGQALFLISLVSDKNHPLVSRILAEVPRFEIRAAGKRFVKGRSDFAEHPAYQTKWLKYGLRALGLPDPYSVPEVHDGYSALFWMDYTNSYVNGGDADNRGEYPYLGWACDHFHNLKRSPISDRDYPLTWEQNASQADYEGMKLVEPEFTHRRLCAPHTWHASEVLLYALTES
jgi:hypothetical protein